MASVSLTNAPLFGDFDHGFNLAAFMPLRRRPVIQFGGEGRYSVEQKDRRHWDRPAALLSGKHQMLELEMG